MATLPSPRRLLLLASLFLSGFLSALSAAQAEVERWGIFELELKGPSEGNPFLDTTLSAEFRQGERTLTASGFYDGDGVYRVRFMPEETGSWSYVTRSNVPALSGQTGSFSVKQAGQGNRGPVRVANTYHFAYADGTPFKQVGTTSYTWTHRPQAIEEQTLRTLAASPFNKIRMCVFPQTHGTKTMPPQRFPFEGDPLKPDYSRFNPSFFQHLEKRIGQLRDLGIECDLILLHPYDDNHIWNLDNMPAEVDDRYLRYVVARLAAYRNIWWSLANEYDFLTLKKESDWDRMFQVVQSADPHNHLRSIHNGKRFYDHNKAWVTHASIQNGIAVEEAGRALLYREIFRKPVVFDEIVYEGNSKFRWAKMDGREMVHRFWTATIAGNYAGHGEVFPEQGEQEESIWIGQGGSLRGESPARLAFLRKILEDSPASGIEPINKWWSAGVGGKPGEYYLVYFGREKPQSWDFSLYNEAIAEGSRFTVEIIDTWDMTITPVEGVFIAKAKDLYTVADEQGRSIALPGKPGIALRVRLVPGSASAPKSAAPRD